MANDPQKETSTHNEIPLQIWSKPRDKKASILKNYLSHSLCLSFSQAHPPLSHDLSLHLSQYLQGEISNKN